MKINIIVSGVVMLSSLMSFAKDRETPVVLDKGISVENAKQEPWIAPSYLNQESVIGYNSKDFSLPNEKSVEMKERVQFWIDIYSKYTTDSGLLHDSVYPDLVYKILSLPKVVGEVPEERKAIRKQRRDLVKSEKQAVKDQLLRLDNYWEKNKKTEYANLESELSEDDKRIWKLFAKNNALGDFKKASEKFRLRLQLGLKNYFLKGVNYSGYYLKEIESIFQKHGLPKELTRLPFVESSFNIHAYSKVGASGIWQFMRSSARPYLKINRHVDERNNPIKASHAAAKLLLNNYKMLENWPLAITAYNYGPSGVRRLTKKYKTKDLEELIDKVEKKRFGFASKNFYATFLAAVEVEKNITKYFPNPSLQPKWALPIKTKAIKLSKSIDWSQLVFLFNEDEELTKLYNPELTSYVRKRVFSIPKGYEIQVPEEKFTEISNNISGLKAARTIAQYKVRRGDTLSDLAAKFKVSLRRLININGIISAKRLRIGQKLAIPSD